MILGLVVDDEAGAKLINDMVIRIHGFRSVNMHDRIRLSLARLNPYIATAGMQLSDLITKFGWQQSLKQFEELRDLLLRMENDCTRNCWGYSFWLRLTLDYLFSQEQEVGPRDWIIFPITHVEEYNELQDAGGCTVLITKPRLNKLAYQPSKTDPQIHDFKLVFDGSKENLYNDLLMILNSCKLRETGDQ